MKSHPLLKALPPGLRVTLVDVGSAGGIHPRWRPLSRRLDIVGFDPRAAKRDERQDGGRRLTYACGLDAAPGHVPLYRTAMPNMSSMHRPNAELLARFRKKPAHARVEAEEEMRVDTLDRLAAEDGFAPDALKCDVQGAEARVLEGAARALAETVLIAEVEVSFLERYDGQPLACEIFQRMEQADFELIDMTGLKRYRAANSASIGNVSTGRGHRAGRLAYGDALFMKTREALRRQLDGRGGQAALKLVLLLAAYGKLDMAAQALDEFGEDLDDGTRQAVMRALGRTGRRGGRQYLGAAAEWLAKRV